ncbi:hypothetical protein CK203_101328 [Vitis vinifera]|uniref:Pol polyprotein n=1 Tax=Vitis vinifera TaxID=29760 RepID=A0A438C5K9_VITVI|nr:hypothetical protein CK203_101328 [Vitis vinifera]
MQKVVRAEVLKLLQAGIIYPISDSLWVSPTTTSHFHLLIKCLRGSQAILSIVSWMATPGEMPFHGTPRDFPWHIISKKGIEVDKEKVELIAKLPSPTTTTKSALGCESDVLLLRISQPSCTHGCGVLLKDQNQGTLAGHESAETPIGNVSAGHHVSKMPSPCAGVMINARGLGKLTLTSWDLFPMSFGYSYILVGVDYVSKWVEAIPCKRNDHRVVLKFLKENIFPRFGVPKAIISDGAYKTILGMSPYCLVYGKAFHLPAEVQYKA